MPRAGAQFSGYFAGALLEGFEVALQCAVVIHHRFRAGELND